MSNLTSIEIVKMIKDALTNGYDHYMACYYDKLEEIENEKTSEENKAFLKELLEFYLDMFDLVRNNEKVERERFPK